MRFIFYSALITVLAKRAAAAGCYHCTRAATARAHALLSFIACNLSHRVYVIYAKFALSSEAHVHLIPSIKIILLEAILIYDGCE